MQYFRDLGNTVKGRWAARGFDKLSFPDLVHEVLEEMPAHRHFQPDELLEAVVRTPDFVNRGSSDTFGQPSVPVYLSSAFHIEVLYWFHATTGIHQHNFAGAFQVLSGSSVHASYAFDVTERVHPSLHLGSTRLRSIELLAQGDTRRILPGTRFAHALFHMDSPSTTIVVRTHPQREYDPEMYYAPPWVAINGFHADRSLSLRRRALVAAAKIAPAKLESLTRQAVAKADAPALYLFLETYVNTQPDAGKRAVFFDELGQTHGTIVGKLQASLEEQRRIATIHKRRQDVRAPELRFFLALLLYCPDRQHVFDLVARRYPDRDPPATILRWIDELTALPSTLDAAEPNALGKLLSAEDQLIVARALGGETDEVLDVAMLKPLFTVAPAAPGTP